VTFLSGGLAGSTEIFVTMPLDTIKTRAQIMGTSPMDTTRTILGSKGPMGFYSGMSAMLLQVSFKQAIRFLAFEQLRNLLQYSAPPGSIEGPKLNFIAGVGAGVATCFWSTPTDRLKTLLQREVHSANPKYVSLNGALRTVLAEQGPRGLFVGIFPTAVKQGTGAGVRFMVYDEMKRAIASGEKATPLESLVAGMMTGTIAALLNQPLDTAKSRIQAQDIGSVLKYSGLFQCLTKVVRDEGPLALYAGSTPRILRVTIGTGIIFSVQEQISRGLRSFIVA